MTFTTLPYTLCGSVILLGLAHGFMISPTPMAGVRLASPLASTATETPISATTEENLEESTAVRAPLKYLGPYPAMALRFPQLGTAAQRDRNETGVSLDFVVDTAANVNVINGQVASELGLEKVGTAPGGLGPGGAMEGGDTFMLGECELDGISDQFTFMTGLTASALPVANPAAAGLLSSAFLNAFEGGVEFSWGKVEDGKITEVPSVTFYGEETETNTDDMALAKVTPLPVTMLPSITVKINGVEMPALLDTGSPITALNEQAAKVAGIDKVGLELPKKSNNPFANVANNFKLAQAASRGEVLTLAGSNGEAINLIKSESKANVAVAGEDQDIDFGSGHVFVGDLPGLAALDALGDKAPPAVVLGSDVLRCRPKMLYRAQQNEVFF